MHRPAARRAVCSSLSRRVVSSYHRVETDWSTSFRDATFDFIAPPRQPPPRLDAAEGRATLAFALAAQLSATEHREVAVAELAGRHAGAERRYALFSWGKLLVGANTQEMVTAVKGSPPAQ